MKAIDEYFNQLQGDTLICAEWLHQLLTDKGLVPKIRYGIPFYYGQKWVCYINPVKKGLVEIAFLNALKFTDPTGLLDFKNRKMVAGYTISSLEDLKADDLGLIVDAAIQYDKYIPS